MAIEVGMDIGRALRALKSGLNVTRTAWDGTRQWVAMIGNSLNHGSIGIADAPELEEGETEPSVVPFFVIRTMANTLEPWMPNSSDLLAEDWKVVS